MSISDVFTPRKQEVAFDVPKKAKTPKPKQEQSSSIWKKLKETGKNPKLPVSRFIRTAVKKATGVTPAKASFIEQTNEIKKKITKKLISNEDVDEIDKDRSRHGPVKITSLFGNNPEIPNIPHRAVKPVKEAVFSESSFKDLEIHPYMVRLKNQYDEK